MPKIKNYAILLFVLFSWSFTTQAKINPPQNSQAPYSLIISGGVSLGIYEAGLNWIILEEIKKLHENSATNKFKLGTITGASAGAINTLISAIRTCEDESTPSYDYDNLFLIHGSKWMRMN